MKLFVGMAVSLAKTAIRASGEHGEIVEEAEAASEPMLRARSSLRLDLAALEKQVRRLARGDPVCLRSTTMPWVGTVVALAHLPRTDGDNGSPLRSSKRVGPWVGPTASRNRSG
ncbi:MAG: hypothetical protein GDA40_07155, partial [Rhodobacteraceae bacterium]|nr:hypothetical protein [Paracoccaceae bacterium]